MNSKFKTLSITEDMIQAVQLTSNRLIDKLAEYIGKRVYIHETLCIGDNLDKHFITMSNIQMILGRVGVRFSGSRICIMSPDYKLIYEISQEDIYRIDNTDDGYRIYECLGESEGEPVKRITTISIDSKEDI